jgi:rod shape-determining protein MreD
MNGLALAGIVLAAALVQSSAGPDLAVAGAEPNLVLALVAARSWLSGLPGGLWVALGGGLLLDLASQGPLGVHALALLAAAGATGLLAARSDQSNAIFGALAAVPATIAYSLVVLTAAHLLHQPLPPPAVAFALVLTGAAYQAALTLALLIAVRPWARSPAL